jgi:4-amino-4-deoxy-L-arabinose transferase-like glycosyltransferase
MSGRSEALPSTYGLSQGGVAFLIVVGLTLARFALAPFIPLAFDEAYYWRWSTHFATGYFDHPPLVAWLISAGTATVGNNELGVRLLPLVLSVPASWAVWRSAVILFRDRGLAMTALIFFNLTLIVAVGTILATPDASLLIASAFLLYCLAKVVDTGRPIWWIAAGAVVGVGCLAKYTALFWPPSIFAWLLLSPRMRPWLRTPWPWIALTIALLIFFPNLVWNANHDWVTFTKQFGRVELGNDFTPQYLFEHLGTEIGMATPIIFVLGWLGIAAFFTRRGGARTVRILIAALVLPTTIYFIFHALHARVEGNWTGPIFPAFVLAAAASAHSVDWHGATAKFVRAIRPWAVPVGLVFVLAIYGQTLTGLLPLGTWDPTASRIGAGIEAIADEVETIRQEEGATLILTDSYPMTGWMSFYNPTDPMLVHQANEPERWPQEPPLTPEQRAGPVVAVVKAGDSIAPIEDVFGTAEKITTLIRTRGSLTIVEYDVYRLPGAAAP